MNCITQEKKEIELNEESYNNNDFLRKAYYEVVQENQKRIANYRVRLTSLNVELEELKLNLMAYKSFISKKSLDLEFNNYLSGIHRK